MNLFPVIFGRRNRQVTFQLPSDLFLILKDIVQTSDVRLNLHNELVALVEVLLGVPEGPDAAWCARNNDSSRLKCGSLRDEADDL